MPMCFIPMAGGAPIPIDKAVLLFGRQPDCDVVLKASRKVSRRHCCVAQINGEFVVRDLGSMNGIRINGNLIRKEGRIRVGDEIHIGDQGYRLAAVDNLPKKGAPAPTPPASSKKPIVTPDPKYLSLDIPVAIPDEGKNFAVEETAPKLKSVTKKKPGKKPPSVIDLGESDIIDD
jgi:predicted component of type VI protein secretion system